MLDGIEKQGVVGSGRFDWKETLSVGVVLFHRYDPFEAIAGRTAEKKHGLKVWVIQESEGDGFDICKMVEVEANQVGMPDELFGLALAEHTREGTEVEI